MVFINKSKLYYFATSIVLDFLQLQFSPFSYGVLSFNGSLLEVFLGFGVGPG